MNNPWPLIVAVAGSLLVLAVVYRVLKDRSPPPILGPGMRIDVTTLADSGPPRGPTLECYNVPVRLAALVVAPVGRAGLPDADELKIVLEALTPGLSSLIFGHGTQVFCWPVQLSPRGFAHSFFSEAPLPGDRGKGTPWSALAGRLDALGRPLMIGLILRAAAPNSLGQTIIESEQKWLDVLRVRG